jgi:peroxiredoxin
MLPLGTPAPAFNLPNINEQMVSLDSFAGKKGLLVMFICNHCPFVKHVRSGLAKMGKEMQAKGIGVVAINSNDVETHPDDHPNRMAEDHSEAGYTFPYLYDETQEVAKAYRAACTPDFFLFDGAQRLVYRGQMDPSRPGNGIPVTGADLNAAADAMLAGKGVDKQIPSAGCNIKWRAGNAPDYFPQM